MKKAPERLLKALQQAETLQAAKKTSKALQAARQAYGLAVDYLPILHPERRRAARLLGRLLESLNQPAEAARYLMEAGDLEADSGLESQLVVQNAEATKLLEYGLTLELFELAAHNLELANQLPPDCPVAIHAMAIMARVCHLHEDWKAAEKLYQGVLSLGRDVEGMDEQVLISTLLELGQLYLQTERVTRSEPLYREAIERQRSDAFDGLVMAETLGRYASIRLKMGQAEKALEAALESLELRRAALGSEHPTVAKAWQLLAIVQLKLDENEKAEESFRECWRIADATLGSEHPLTLKYLCELGLHLLSWRRDRAEEGWGIVRKVRRLGRQLPHDEPIREQLETLLADTDDLFDEASKACQPLPGLNLDS